MAGSVAKLLRPRSIAVIGATNRPDSLGGKVTARLFEAGFTGRIYPVNPRQFAVHSTPTYPSVSDIPGEVDLALVVVPREFVKPAVVECCAKGVAGVVVITAGFGEIDAAGRAQQEELAAICRDAGVRLIGPNCMGLINTAPAVALDATFSPTPALPGPIGFASQSGALGVAVLNICHERGIGFSQFVSFGNKADVTENDLLEAWEHDPEVPVIALYLESFADPARFYELARRITPRKPIVLVKAGRTEAGARAASSHTGALAAGDTGAEALCRQAGILRAGTVEEMLDIALVLSRCPLPAGDRIAVLTNAGGPAILCADALAELRLTLPPLAEETRAGLRAALPREAALANPVDMVASAGPPQYATCLDLLLRDPGIDAVITITVTPPLPPGPIETLQAMQPVFAGASKPALAVFMAGEEFYGQVHGLGPLPPCFRLPESAARALSAVAGYARRRASPAPDPAALPADDATIAGLLAARAADGGGYLDPDATFRVLAAAGIPVVPWRVARDRAGVLAAADAVGFPVVLKATGERLVHKADVGGVALDLRDRAALDAALERIAAALSAAGSPPGSYSWLVQEFRRGGREVIVGAARDPTYGPLVMFGLGGTYVEVFRDVLFGLAPLARAHADEMVRSIRGLRLLTGTRGQAGVDLEPAVDALVRVGQLAARHKMVEELDINPLLLYPGAGGGAAVDGRIRVGPQPDDMGRGFRR